jgi:plastocyanin
MRHVISRKWFALLITSGVAAGVCIASLAQQPSARQGLAEVSATLAVTHKNATHKAERFPPAVIWLSPIPTNPAQPATVAPAAPGNFTLLQKDKMFTPHLLVVPVGSSVSFPNADPFFHNVFSLFDGRRFDLGLYEAGSTRSVVFSREGVSYIFCNIHSEMSAVVISLATPLYAFADTQGSFHLKNVPHGEYDLHVWIEGQKQTSLDQLTRRVHVSGPTLDLGEIISSHPDSSLHLNKFGRPYDQEARPVY